MRIAKFNDALALLIVIACLSLWLIDPYFRYRFGVGLPDQVVGATIALINLPAIFYFRKSKGEKPEDG